MKAKKHGHTQQVLELEKNANAEYVLNTAHENVKIAHNKLWYILVEKDVSDEDGTSLHLIKYKNGEGVEVTNFVAQLKEQYMKTIQDEKLKEIFSKIVVRGNNGFSHIKNIPDIEIFEKKMEK